MVLTKGNLRGGCREERGEAESGNGAQGVPAWGTRVLIKCDCQTRVQQKGTCEMEAGKEEVRLIQGVGERMRGTRILGIQYQSRVQCMVNNTHMRSLWHSS